MSMTCGHDCGASGTAITILLLGVLIAFALARRSRVSLLVPIPVTSCRGLLRWQHGLGTTAVANCLRHRAPGNRHNSSFQAERLAAK